MLFVDAGLMTVSQVTVIVTTFGSVWYLRFFYCEWCFAFPAGFVPLRGSANEYT